MLCIQFQPWHSLAMFQQQKSFELDNLPLKKRTMHKFHSLLENRLYQLGEQDSVLFELNLIQLHSKRLLYYEILVGFDSEYRLILISLWQDQFRFAHLNKEYS